MNGQTPDVPEHLRRTEGLWARKAVALSLQLDSDQLQNERLRLLLKVVIDDLLDIYQEMRAFTYAENLEAIEAVLTILPHTKPSGKSS